MVNEFYHLKTGSTITEYSYDAWGRRRDKDDWSYTLTSEPALFADRGFTAHEFLSDFNLYNMNGRLYDPVVGRFLSPDPYITDPSFSQSYNRYSYALNNPLKYNDPGGEIIWPFIWAGNWVFGGLDNWINKGMPFKQAFSVKNNPIVASANFNIGNKTWNNYQANAQNLVKQQSVGMNRINREIIQKQQTYGKAWLDASYIERYTATPDATMVIPKFYSNSPLQGQNIFGIGDAISIYNEIAPEGNKIPYIGNILTGIDVYNHLKVGNYPEATWSIIEGVGGVYSVGFKGLAYGYNTNYMQTQIGQGFYQDYIYNLSLYRNTGNEKYLNNAIYYEQLMRKAYNNIQRK